MPIGLSAVGGTIRKGELLPESGPIRHALKVFVMTRLAPLTRFQLQMFAHDYYFGDPNSTCYPHPTCTYRWPAIGRHILAHVTAETLSLK